MTRNFRNLALIAITVCAIAPAAANGATSGLTCGKDYSKNSVNGDYCVSSTAGPAVAAVQPSAAPPAVVVKDDGFSWGNAAAGAGAALVLVLTAAGGVVAMRRRRGSPTLGSHATS